MIEALAGRRRATPMATVTIPDDVYEQLQDAATRKQRPVTDLLNEAIAIVVAASTKNGTEPMTLDEEQRRIREVMKDQIWSEEDVDQLFPWLNDNPMSDEEVDEILANLPVLDPPLSQTIIQMREEERY
jgi:predicted CopG family antitoxin